jgi:hypothetical protein
LTRTMYDGINTLAAGIAKEFPDAEMVAGYINGDFEWSPRDWNLFPHAVHVTISITANADAGDVLDVESGDATVEQAAGWITKRKASGYHQPTIYCNLSTLPAVREATGDLILGVDWACWVADFTNEPHQVTAPGTPKATCAATQFKSTDAFDVSSVFDDEWPRRTAPAKPNPPAKEPTKAPTEPTGIRVVSVTATSLKLEWDAEPDATSYHVRVTSQSKLVKEETVSSATVTVSGLTPDRTFDIHIAASNKIGTSPETSGPSVKTNKS